MDFDPNAVLLEWAAGARWTIRDSFSGVQVLGATGSGKSSGSLPRIFESYLRSGYGGLFLTVKPEDRSIYERYVRNAGRFDDLRLFSPRADLRFNFIASEMEQSAEPVGLAENIMKLIMTVAELGARNNGSRGGSDNAEYFRLAAEQLCYYVLLILVLSGLEVSVPNLHRFLLSIARSREESLSDGWQQNSFCFQCLKAADKAPKSPSHLEDFKMATGFLMEEWPSMNSRTRTTVESTLTTATGSLGRGLVRDMVSAPRSNFSPSMLFDGAIVIADFPVLQYRDVGQQIQVILKYCVQRAAARRDVSRNPRGVFIGADEHQYLAVDADQVAQTTARSSHLAVVNATQSLSTYLAAFGPQSEAKVHSLLGNLQTQIFHQQTDTETIRYIQELIGRSRQFMMNGNSARGGDWLAPLFGNSSGGSAGFSETYEYELQARDLNGLAKGGPPHFTTEAIVYQGGRTFPNGRTWLPVTFMQKR
ncbi:type IV secretory system conjugative DNA transfer family protein [Synechococcus sp. RedBA-s]|uniref:type IV secretory system conjugative DNA transfer family protein n=1 Tax=Synechococcus sp. RedBA-s TaxID=2823741 RepID=UPI0020CD9522|nr:TraM recognition domain-containing protein [Synechococcus sp. RedBA-s]MCP9801792.1 TraM recognition domain-containing protein [Synechococcus sp. RedBA-s]